MEKEEKSLSVLVFFSFLILFFVFMFLKGDEVVQTNEPTTALVILDVVKGDTLFNTIIEIVILIAVLGLIYFLWRYFKKRKAPKIKQAKPLMNLGEMSEQEVESVFSTPLSYPTEKPSSIKPEEKTEPKIKLIKTITKEPVRETRDDRLLNYIKAALSSGYTKDQIKKALLDKKWPLDKIEATLAKA